MARPLHPEGAIHLTDYIVRPARQGDGELIARTLRQADRDELGILHDDPGAALECAIRTAEETFGTRFYACDLAADRGSPVLLWGTARAGDQWPGWGYIWAVASDRLMTSRHLGWFLRDSPHYILFEAERYPQGLLTFSDKRNAAHHRWLEHVGFCRVREVGPYVHFEKPRACVSRPQ